MFQKCRSIRNRKYLVDCYIYMELDNMERMVNLGKVKFIWIFVEQFIKGWLQENVLIIKQIKIIV